MRWWWGRKRGGGRQRRQGGAGRPSPFSPCPPPSQPAPLRRARPPERTLSPLGKLPTDSSVRPRSWAAPQRTGGQARVASGPSPSASGAARSRTRFGGCPTFARLLLDTSSFGPPTSSTLFCPGGGGKGSPSPLLSPTTAVEGDMLKRILPARSCRATCRLRQTGRRGEDETGCLSKCPTVFTLRLPPPLSVGLCPSSPHANQPLATARAAQRATSRYLRGPPLGNWAIRDDRTPGFSRQPGSHALTWSFPAGSPAVQRQPTHALLQTTGSPVNQVLML